MPSTLPTKCPNCGEQIIKHLDTDHIVHRYNLKETCPNGSGRIPVGIAGGDQPGKVIDAGRNQLRRSLSVDVKELGEEEYDAQEGEGDSEDDAEGDSGDEADAESEGDQSDDEREEDEQDESGDSEEAEEQEDQDKSGSMSKNKRKSKKSSQSSSQSSDGESESNSQGAPPPQNDEWAIPAAKDINAVWEERVRLRAYKPTDEELAKIMLTHSKGKVNYKPQSRVEDWREET